AAAARMDPKLTWQTPGWEQTDEYPVTCVSWNDAQAFCAWLSKEESSTYRLATKAEWEYACRAGTQTAYFFGDRPANEYTWSSANSDNKAHANGLLKANGLGLYDIVGNVCACSEIYDANNYARRPRGEPPGPIPR